MTKLKKKCEKLIVSLLPTTEQNSSLENLVNKYYSFLR